MKELKIEKQKILIDGEEKFLISGEIHYFRMDPDIWDRALYKLIEAGCNAVAFYVPWFMHQPAEGVFDFEGKMDSRLNLVKWLELIKSKGLLAFLRPGPYVYAEMENLGIPGWFFDRYPNARVMRWRDGKYSGKGFKYVVSYNHPDYINCVKKWYREVCRIAAQYQQPEGPIYMVQACNEVPLPIGMGGRDQNPETLGLGSHEGMYASFFKNKYGTVKELNRAYDTSYSGFESIRPEELSSIGEQGLNDDLEFYYAWYLPAYFQKLIGTFKENGITVPIAHNAFNPEALSISYHTKKKHPEMLIGVDNYYTMQGSLDAKALAYYCEYGSEIIRNMMKSPPVVLEFESGYWNDYPFVYGPQLYTWLIWTFAAGYRGINMYLFAGGENKPGMGFFGLSHGWQAPVELDGSEGENYTWIKRAIGEVKDNEEVFGGERVYDLTLGIYNQPGLFQRTISKNIVDTNFFMFMDSLSCDVADVEDSETSSLSGKAMLWVVSNEYMDNNIQKRLLKYAEDGGNLVVQGVFPYMGLDGRPACILKDALCAEVQEPDFEGFWYDAKIRTGQDEIYVGKPIQKVAFEGEVLAEGIEGEPVVLRRELGRGSITVVPFNLEFAMKTQHILLEKILDKNKVVPSIKTGRLRGILKKDGCGREFAMLLNYHPIPVSEEVVIRGERHQVSIEPYQYRIVTI